MEQDLSVPVIAIDGPAAVGKGTVARIIAKKLGFHYLDSGAIYRTIALFALQADLKTEEEIVIATPFLQIRFDAKEVYLNSEKVTKEIRTPEVDSMVAAVGKISRVRAQVRNLQLGMRVTPGLVAEGRDMGEIFDTPYRFFLTATAEERSRRRANQYPDLPFDRDLVLSAIKKRDSEDETREVSPLRPHPDACLIDTTDIRDPQKVVAIILTRAFVVGLDEAV